MARRSRWPLISDKVLLVVNTASKCGFTPQYEGLEHLQRTFGPRGFTVLGFPCNQFGNQEPGDAAAIGTFCQLTYDVSFPMFAKIDVNGDGAHPLYRFLKAAKPGLLGTRRHQVELHEIPDRQNRLRRRPLRADHQAEGDRGGYRAAALTDVRRLSWAPPASNDPHPRRPFQMSFEVAPRRPAGPFAIALTSPRR